MRFWRAVQQFIFCSTVCTYGIKIPPQVLVDEDFPQEPISEYGKNKVICEKTLLAAGEAKKFAVTIIRPSSTYRPEHSMIDNLEADPLPGIHRAPAGALLGHGPGAVAIHASG